MVVESLTRNTPCLWPCRRGMASWRLSFPQYQLLRSSASKLPAIVVTKSRSRLEAFPLRLFLSATHTKLWWTNCCSWRKKKWPRSGNFAGSFGTLRSTELLLVSKNPTVLGLSVKVVPKNNIKLMCNKKLRTKMADLGGKSWPHLPEGMPGQREAMHWRPAKTMGANKALRGTVCNWCSHKPISSLQWFKKKKKSRFNTDFVS